MKLLDILAFILLLVGGLNWGLIGAIDMNIVTELLGTGTMATKVVYIAVGVAAIYKVLFFKRCCSKACE